MNCDIDIKHEEDSLVKTEPQDLEYENTTEVKEFLHLDIKHEVHHDDEESQVENADETIYKMSENCKMEIQDQENAEDMSHRNYGSSLEENKDGTCVFDDRSVPSESNTSLSELNLMNKVCKKTVERPFECNVCKKTFVYKKNLIGHMYVHTGERLHKCNICSKSFSHNCNLVRHLRIHSGDKPYRCNICSHSFSHKNTLVRHTRTHIGEEPYVCLLCTKAFSDNETLKTHNMTHTGGEKPFTCVCKKSFAHQSALTSHMRIHTGQLFTCSFCKKSFSKKCSLDVHKHIHMFDKP